MITRLLLVGFSLATSTLSCLEVTSETKQRDAMTSEVTVTFMLAPGDQVFKDFISFSVNQDAHLSEWTASKDARPIHVPEFHAPKLVYDGSFEISVAVTKPKDDMVQQLLVHMNYLSNQNKVVQTLLIPVSFQNDQGTPVAQPIEEKKTTLEEVLPKKATPKLSFYTRMTTALEQLIKTADRLWVRILLIMILGLLMSFTPCIYPMIPITIGIMQGQGHRGVIHNFLHATSYAVGIATTFALLGLIAALSGSIFGTFLSSPLVVVILVAMLVYLAFSMFGFYEIYLPRFLQENNHHHKGSFLSSFLFGAISGSVASPCLSPGLALVLTIVASLGSVTLGFMLLFAFGIGLSIPLLLIGTFSGSLTLMPQAGTWMVEIKKVFGFLLIATAGYYLKNIVPFSVVAWLMAGTSAIAGASYFFSISGHDSKRMKRVKNVLGMTCIAGSVLIATHAYYLTYHQEPTDTLWHTDYTQAKAIAQQTGTLLFIEVSAPACSLCTAIEKNLLSLPKVRALLAHFTPLKMMLTLSDSVIKTFKERYKIIGVPTFLLIDPQTEHEIARWGSELYNVDPDAFIQNVTSHIKPRTDG